MGNARNEEPRESDEDRLHGRKLSGAEQSEAADHLAHERRRKVDTTLRTDGEKDTLYEDGLEIDADAPPLTGVNGKDDSR